jgi:4-hydroxybenzoate polyprenyltransferase
LQSNTAVLPPVALDILRLVRAPLAATAIANGVTGYLLTTVRIARESERGAQILVPVSEGVKVLKPLALAALASTALYWAGMALNDYFDLERDRKLYPFRPLPSGKLPARFALLLGLSLLLLGAAAALGGGGRGALLAAGATAAAIVAYDGLLKRWRLPGCLAMAACRSGNVLLGASIGLAHTTLGPEGAAPLFVPYAFAIGVYIFSVTLLSTFEHEDAPPSGIAVGFLGVLVVPIALGFKLLPAGLPFFVAHAALASVLAGNAARKGTRASGHVTTRWLLRGLLLLDAGVLAGSNLPWYWSAGVLALLVPNLIGAKLLFGSKPPPKPPVPSASPATS